MHKGWGMESKNSIQFSKSVDSHLLKLWSQLSNSWFILILLSQRLRKWKERVFRMKVCHGGHENCIAIFHSIVHTDLFFCYFKGFHIVAHNFELFFQFEDFSVRQRRGKRENISVREYQFPIERFLKNLNNNTNISPVCTRSSARSKSSSTSATFLAS